MIDGKLLVVDDNKSVTDSLEMMLRKEVKTIISLNAPGRINEILGKNVIDIVLLDMNFRSGISTGNEGLFWLREILKLDPDISVIMMTAYGGVDLAVKAIREGAFDFVLKPWDNSRMIATIGAAWKLRSTRLKAASLEKDNRTLKNEINAPRTRVITGSSKAMNDVMSVAGKVASTDANILISGENGTGKELLAREIHNLSSRRNELMVTVDMGAIPDTLFESEMFGHVRGAFTDAREERTGRFELANKGTLFLDEIGNLSASSQSKLLNALQRRSITKVGSNKPVPVDIRLICATNSNLQDLVAKNVFREDLLYRINTINIEIPSLRNRTEDIPMLAYHFLDHYSGKYKRGIKKISPAAMDRLTRYKWPGNVRELQHTIEKAVILSESDILDICEFEFVKVTGLERDELDSLADMEKKMIVDALKKCNNNLSMASNRLGITRQTLYNKIRKYDL